MPLNIGDDLNNLTGLMNGSNLNVGNSLNGVSAAGHLILESTALEFLLLEDGSLIELE